MHHGVAILSRVPLKDPGKHDWQDNGEARHVGVRLECGVRVENVYVPAGGDTPDRTLNPKFGQKLDFIERMTRWSESLRAHDHRWRLQRGPARVRRLESPGSSHSRQPHACRGRGADQIAAGARLDRHRPQVRPGAGTMLYVVELPLTRLDEERPRPPSRPYVVLSRA